MKTNNTKAFTLVELIVVITILAILGTIAFISLEGYSKSARDSKRISDIQNIKTSLELFSLNTGKYPNPDTGVNVLYNTEIVWTQGKVGDNVKTNLSRTLSKKTRDPLTELDYTYSVINSKTQYELLSIYESDIISYKNNLFNFANASDSNYPKIDGTYNGVFVKTPTYYIPTPSIINSELDGIGGELTNDNIDSQIITGGDNNITNGENDLNKDGLSNLTIQAFSGVISSENDDNKEELANALIIAYSGTILANEGIYAKIVNTTGTQNLISLVDDIVLNSGNYASTLGEDNIVEKLIDETDCIEAGWYWIDSSNDVYIGENRGDGFCISPRFGDWNNDSNLGDGGIAWSSWGNVDSSYYGGWDSDPIDDSGNPFPIYGQTRILDSQSGYSCLALNEGAVDVIGSDTILGRMKWLATVGNNYDEAIDIDWIINVNPLNGHAIPAIFIADCIDGKKDLGTDMAYNHYPSINLNKIITYNEYKTDVSSDTDLTGTGNITYYNRQRYLTAWTQKSGSHLPSAFSYISDGFSSASDPDGNFLEGNDRGEYQVACELLNTDNNTDFYEDGIDDSGSGDSDDGEQIWLSAIGFIDGTAWGRKARILGLDGCSNQSNHNTGMRSGSRSARFIVRP